MPSAVGLSVARAPGRAIDDVRARAAASFMGFSIQGIARRGKVAAASQDADAWRARRLASRPRGPRARNRKGFAIPWPRRHGDGDDPQGVRSVRAELKVSLKRNR